MLRISKYGIKIKNINAAVLYEVNLGVRDYFTYTDAMLNNSLFSDYMKKNGLKIHRKKRNPDDESTRDVVCIDFGFGSKSYEDELKRINRSTDELLVKIAENETEIQVLKEKNCTDEEKYDIQYQIDKMESKIKKYKERILFLSTILEKVENKKELYDKKSKEELRTMFYNDGVDITYHDKIGEEIRDTTIHYKMLFRTSAKAKIGQAMFINEKLYDKAYNWMTMGIGSKMPETNAKIVELSAYAPLTTSTIIGKIHVPVENMLILEDKDSFFNTFANVVTAKKYNENDKNDTRKYCCVKKDNTDVKNTLWDGMMLIDSSVLPDWINSMALLRNHFFKSCAFRTEIQLFFKDWCRENNADYNTLELTDMFGNKHFAKDIKMITTNNSIKWMKFQNLIGRTKKEAYTYWCRKVKKDGCLWGVVKTDHPSKLGDKQQLSYQMINTLPCDENCVRNITQESIDYVNKLKDDDEEFVKYLNKYANDMNNYEMLADLYIWNNDFSKSKFFRKEKTKIINQYVYKLRTGKIFVNGDNLTLCGNPYALLLYSVGDEWENDPTLNAEEDCIQCFTNRFNDDEYLAAFRNPHNAPNNVCYFHNKKSEIMKRYFKWTKNIIAVNCIKTDLQQRLNGADFDSDFVLVTNNKYMVECAKKCYTEYHTIVNDLQESGITYNNTMDDYAKMDNKFAKTRIGIGYSSNLAQLAMTYYWTESNKQCPNIKDMEDLYDNFVILSVVAQLEIDSCKREYEISGCDEIDRISKMICMKKYGDADFPEFMRYTREIKHTKNGIEIPYEEVNEKKNKLQSRIGSKYTCPMNYLQKCFDEIKRMDNVDLIDTKEFFIKSEKDTNRRQMKKILEYIYQYDKDIKRIVLGEDTGYEFWNEFYKYTDNLYNSLRKIKISNESTINRLIEIALDIGRPSMIKFERDIDPLKFRSKILNVLYRYDKEKFLQNFKRT